MTSRNKLKKYQLEQVEKANKLGLPLFLGIPDFWYENVTYACENGTISHNYLKSEERGALCFCCMNPIFIVSPDTTKELLKEIL